MSPATERRPAEVSAEPATAPSPPPGSPAETVRLHHFKVAGLQIPSENGLLREPTRPVHLRGAEFEGQFDRQTLIYDAIAATGGDPVRLVCPPFLNIHDAVRRARFSSIDGKTEYGFKIRDLDRQSQILVNSPPEMHVLRMSSDLGDHVINLPPAADHLFAGQRVVFTLSKNNRLVWIKDWARFYRDVHGATAFIIVDNASTAYSAGDLLEALGSIRGISCAAVVDWPFRHGPTGLGQKRFWDSNFSQLGAFEVIRWRFLQQARSVLNCDIDELVVSDRGRSVFEHVENTIAGVTAFYGDWVFGLNDHTRVATEGEPLRFRDFRHVLKRRPDFKYGIIPHYPMRCRAKWAAVPRRCPPGAQWHVHTINGWWPSRIINGSFQFRHFREINFNWKYDRLNRESLDPTRHVEDPSLQAAYARVDWGS